MENCVYKEVDTNAVKRSGHGNCDQFMWRPFLRQLLVCSGVWTSYFVYGLCFGAPTVFIPQIRREANSTAAISNEMASWLTSVFSFAGFPWVIVLSALTKMIGRKICFMIMCVDTFGAFVVLFYSTDVTQILLSEVLQGPFTAGQLVISILILTEYISPKYRGLFLTLKSATFYWGIWAANAIGTFLHWKQIALIGIVCSAYTVGTVFFWPESPYWLASKGRFKECSTSHRWLKGCDEQSEKELEDLINSQKEYVRSNLAKVGLKNQLLDVYQTFKGKPFYKPTLISMVTGTASVFSGKMVYTLYAIDILKKITGSESTAYTGMLTLDGITVLSMYCGCILAKKFKRRTLFLTSSSIGIVILFIISCYLYAIELSFIEENKFVSLALLALLSISISCGPLIMAISIFGELIPLRSRTLSTCVIAISGMICVGTVLKVAPYVFKSCGLHGAFLMFGIGSSACWYLLYKYLPETKDKTLIEIAESLVKIKENKPVTNIEALKLSDTFEE